MKRSGFTLIELLVVIAIIAILAAILFPVFAQAREKARQTACLSNGKQLALAFIQYEQDYDELTPCGVALGGSGWAGQLYTYVKSLGVFQCPDDNILVGGSSFAMNQNISPWNPSNPPVPASAALSQFASPAKSVLLFEVANSDTNATYYNISLPATQLWNSDLYYGASPRGFGLGEDYDPGGYNSEVDAGATSGDGHLKYATGYMRGSLSTGYVQFLNPLGRHSEGSTFIFADGHAKLLRGSAVSAGWNNASNANCGGGTYPLAANTECGDSTIAATFSLQ